MSVNNIHRVWNFGCAALVCVSGITDFHSSTPSVSRPKRLNDFNIDDSSTLCNRYKIERVWSEFQYSQLVGYHQFFICDGQKDLSVFCKSEIIVISSEIAGSSKVFGFGRYYRICRLDSDYAGIGVVFSSKWSVTTAANSNTSYNLRHVSFSIY